MTNHFFGIIISLIIGAFVFVLMYSKASFHKDEDLFDVSFLKKLPAIIISIITALLYGSIVYFYINFY
ncbi:hypothetical protein [Campylobacter sp. CCUG 57310]|uniref:hypothetical protein n=1 Tax=Campylobacter sp. CCUG 57310 TaxID=2517362 RepID=UPI0015651794|nr:hypothetical protein [Campylobacter sp. CCUG 57310]QKF93235.1 hypothetical protein CORI_a049 [Campylobacter sp. CCUG 57310]